MLILCIVHVYIPVMTIFSKTKKYFIFLENREDFPCSWESAWNREDFPCSVESAWNRETPAEIGSYHMSGPQPWFTVTLTHTYLISNTVPSKSSRTICKMDKISISSEFKLSNVIQKVFSKKWCWVSNSMDQRSGPTIQWAWSRSILLCKR